MLHFSSNNGGHGELTIKNDQSKQEWGSSWSTPSRSDIQELLDYCREQKNNFSDLSMVDSFVLRRVSKVVNAISNKKTSEALAYEIERNELMRQRSMEYASKRHLY